MKANLPIDTYAPPEITEPNADYDYVPCSMCNENSVLVKMPYHGRCVYCGVCELGGDIYAYGFGESSTEDLQNHHMRRDVQTRGSQHASTPALGVSNPA